ncbi:MAG: CDP-alcohol phosphatidyltransferase family protein [Chromatiaceae bacterium]
MANGAGTYDNLGTSGPDFFVWVVICVSRRPVAAVSNEMALRDVGRISAVTAVKLRDLPNAISLLRLLAVIPVVFLLLQREFGWALVLFAAAGLSDGLDGFLAKQFGWQSQLGGILDPLADKVLLMASFLVLGTLSLIPAWLVVAVIFRDLLIMGGALMYHYGVEELNAAPTLTSKLNTLLQILLVVLVITDAGPMPMSRDIIAVLIWACLTTVVLSGSQYVWVWSRKAAAKGWRRD